jgi:hypothetical protein
VCDFTDGAILGSQDFVRSFTDVWQMEKGRKHPPKVNRLRSADWVGSNHDSRPQAAGVWLTFSIGGSSNADCCLVVKN